MTVPGCPLCEKAGGRVVLQTPKWRLIHAQEAGFPAFYRLVWQEHVREFSQLARADRIVVVDVLAAVEQAMLQSLHPAKVNLASLGNAVPHLHWHVIARFDWDSHFPGAVWAALQREADAARVQQVAAALPGLEEAFKTALLA
ncbi:HIT family protein [Ramlibacter sp.]|uniref:HIT family protein n=1 Tax=Ramlibacter sp. TaxID=1917967 RepID=UPI002612E48D|nr:HIT family protein [Ramlibacter sp.]MDB5957426.1 histidine triad protein [Ramlibacter sp.]